jgi:KDO2-lipid IV(A) lauroyltransferase
MVAFLADQRGDPERGVFVDFFGTPAPANEVFARLAIEGNAWVMPLCTFRLENGNYQSIFGEPVQLELTGDHKTDLINVSQQFHTIFEQWLRDHPEQGFWVHRKWHRKRRKRRIFKKKKKWQR